MSDQVPESNEITTPNKELDFSKLTHQNWLFINAFLSSGSVIKAYKLAKYEGVDQSAPYQVFKRLKTYIEQIGDLDVTSRARLQADIKSVLDIPLEERTTLKLKEWLDVRKFTAKITPEAKATKQQISVLVINRASQKNETNGPIGKEGTQSNTSPLDSQQVIDVEEIK